MNEWLGEQKRKSSGIFRVYGKVILAVTFVFLCAGLIYAITHVSVPQKLRVSFLDIGQGDAILIQTPSGKQMLIDGGPSDRVISHLSRELSFFDRTLDAMIATHGDADHVTGLIPVLEKYKVQNIIHSPIEAKTGIFDDLKTHIQNENAQTYVAQKGDVIHFGDGVVVHVLYPSKTISPKTETNDASVSVVIQYGTQSFLLTGDLTTKYEPQLIGATLSKNVTVYKAGHHGSKTSSGEQLLTYIRPEYAVISAGKDNKYGHPNPEAFARLEKYSKEILTTIDRGTISFVTDGRTIAVETER
jgi:competence protein ComEC